MLTCINNYVKARKTQQQINEDEINQLYSEMSYKTLTSINIKTVKTIHENVVVELDKLIEMATLIDDLKQENNILKQQPFKLFTIWKGNMITYNNTSHTPNDDDARLSLVDGRNSNVLAWDSRASGWIQFTFDNPVSFIATRFRTGTSIWNIEYSDNQQAWIKVGTYQHPGMCVWINAGPHKYWRYNLVTNQGSPYYCGYEWYTIN